MLMVLASIFMLVLAIPCFSYGDVSDNLLKDVQQPKTTSIETTKEGLVEIQTGLLEGDTFHQVRKCNGFLVSNADGNVYVVTTRHGVSVNSNDRKKAGVDENATKSVRIIIRSDVASELTELTSSKKQDFCVLQSNDVVKSKGTVTLKQEVDLPSGAEIQAVGFPKDDQSETPLQYEANDAEEHLGRIQHMEQLDGIPYIAHSAFIGKNFDGSVLVNENGFVVGMNNASKNDGDQFYALQIQEIEKVLDNYGVPYSTNQTEMAYNGLYSRCEQAIKQDNQSRYKAESKQNLEYELENAVGILMESPCDLTALQEADRNLEKAQHGLKAKVQKTTWVIIVLAAVILVLLVRFIGLLRWKRAYGVKKEKTQKKKEKQINSNPIIDENESEKTIVIDPENSIKSNKSKQKNRLVILFWSRTNEQIRIEQSEFVIGKKRELVDFAIEDNRLVSRKHAAIQITNSGVRIVDLKSSNGTYVNEQMVPEGGMDLQSGDLLRLANEEFVVEII